MKEDENKKSFYRKYIKPVLVIGWMTLLFGTLFITVFIGTIYIVMGK